MPVAVNSSKPGKQTKPVTPEKKATKDKGKK